VGKPDGMRTFGRPRRLWEDKIKTDLREIGWGCYGLNASDSFENGNGISGSIKFWEIPELLCDCWLLKKESAS
jgi:hypothetical protein